MRRSCLYIIVLFVVLGLDSCSVGKFIPEGGYLLDDVRIASDNKELKTGDLYTYIRQNPNARWFSLVKVPMHIYCLSGTDSTKRSNRFFRKIGDKPVIYDRQLAERTQTELQKAVQNQGYMRARVYLDEQTRGHKLKLTYRISPNRPYVVNTLAYDIDDPVISQLIAADSTQSLLQQNMLMDVNKLENERIRITHLLQGNGYYRFNKDFITFQADTARNTHEVALTMRLMPYRQRTEDAPRPHSQYYIRKVNYIVDGEVSGIDSLSLASYMHEQKDRIDIFNPQKTVLRPSVVSFANHIQPGSLYDEQQVQLTYNALSRLNNIRYSNIRFVEVTENDTLKLDAYVTLAKGQNKAVSFEIEGTNSAGDLGAAAAISYQHRNVFKGAELFTAKLRGAYEAITASGQSYVNDNYTEYGVETSLVFPDFKFPFLKHDFKKKIRATSQVSAQYTSQVRPEFTRMLLTAAWSYHWTPNKRYSNRLDVLDINYVYMPRKSAEFQEYLNKMTEHNSLLKTSFENVLIIKLGYTFSYNSAGNAVMKTPTRNSYSIRFNIEESGNLMYAFSKMLYGQPKKEGGFELANMPYAQYIKTDFDWARNLMLDMRNSLVFHAGLGVAYPFGNSKMLPFEKRYFSGGANSVRGWSVRSLGPGNFRGTESERMDYVNKTGDIKLDLNLEYRTYLFWKLNGALFVDAGNVWTIRSDSEQERGVFRFNQFYKQLALSYGLGVRFDLDFLILRFDGGMKAINPEFEGKDHFPILHPKFSRDFAFHFAVGYPF